MTAEQGVFTLLSTSSELAAALGCTLAELADGTYLIRAGAGVDPPDRWLGIRWEEDLYAANSGRRMLSLRGHDRQRSYDRVDRMLDVAKATLTAVVHQHGITQVDYQGRSPDLIDDGYKTSTRYDTFAVVAGYRRKDY